MKRATRIRQSEVAFRSGIRLVLFMMALWLCATFFCVTHGHDGHGGLERVAHASPSTRGAKPKLKPDMR